MFFKGIYVKIILVKVREVRVYGKVLRYLQYIVVRVVGSIEKEVIITRGRNYVEGQYWYYVEVINGSMYLVEMY